jgi:hypothetical protein
MLDVVKLVPVPNELPPLNPAYQLIVPPLAVAPNVTVPVLHLDAGVVPVMLGIGLTVIVALALVAESHEPLFTIAL